MGHSHAHTHDDEHARSAFRRGLVGVVAALSLLAVIGAVVWWPRGEAPELNPGSLLEYVDASVTSVEERQCSSIEIPDALTGCQIVEAEVTSGPTDGATASFRIYATDFDAPELVEGDDVVLFFNPRVEPSVAYSYVDFQRGPPLVVLGVLFVVAVVVLGRMAGARALLGIAVSFLVIFTFLLPSLIRGNPALPVALAATVLIAVAVLYLAHGFRATTTVALVGTLFSLLVVAVLAQVFVEVSHLTGLVADEGQVLRVTAQAVDLRALLVAAMVIGALGVLDDVTVTQVAAVAELRHARPEASRREVYGQAIRIGRDHIASTVNTLVLAYAGASLPLLLVFIESNRPWSRLATSEIVAIEIVRTLVGSIGLVLAVPVTTALAAALLDRAPRHGDEETDRPTGGDGPGPPRRSDGASEGVRPDEWKGFGPVEDPW